MEVVQNDTTNNINPNLCSVILPGKNRQCKNKIKHTEMVKDFALFTKNTYKTKYN